MSRKLPELPFMDVPQVPGCEVLEDTLKKRSNERRKYRLRLINIKESLIEMKIGFEEHNLDFRLEQLNEAQDRDVMLTRDLRRKVSNNCSGKKGG